ncbi:MAG TPA: hypothetical protein VLM79_14335 [Kofleriaceae bacterium]|nr:hypothetical protein [Kofleriaceae bacterium]
MLRGLLFVIVVVAIAGCPGGSGRVGDTCGGNDDCSDALQCLNRTCIPRCDRATECGDGYSCDAHGLCQRATLGAGERCESEVDCIAGFTCQTSGAVDRGKLAATCNAEVTGHLPGAECSDDTDCHVGNCALGHCMQLCRASSECPDEKTCMQIPHPVTVTATFGACLPSEGVLSWTIPMKTPSGEVLVPIPAQGRSAELVMTVDDPNQKVGATSVLAPITGDRLYKPPCSPELPADSPCDAGLSLDDYYRNPIRHRPAFGQSVLLIPTAAAGPARPGVYRVVVSSLRANDMPGSAIPQVTAVVQLNTERTMRLDLHFFFLGLEDHPCQAMTDGKTLNASTAKSAFFQDQYIGEMRTLLFKDGKTITIDTRTYEDITDHPELDGLDIANVGDLLQLGKYSTGINIFFVRSLSPMGLQAYGPNPGPAGIAGTRQSGIVIALDTLCYRNWQAVARITMPEIGRYMGLYHNVEPEVARHPLWRDQIDDNDAEDPRNNLMFFSERGLVNLTPGQVEVLKRSAVLR